MKTETKMTKAEVVSFEERFLMLHLQYEVKDENSKRLIDIPCLEVPIYTEHLPLFFKETEQPLCTGNCNTIYKPNDYYVIKMSGDEARLYQNENGVAITERILETYPHEMTIEEIEKSLGYSVKIVKEKKRE